MELGSEYNLSLEELSICENNIFDYLSEYDNCFYFDSGRNAIRHLVNHLTSYTRFLLPEFICCSVSDCFEKSKIQYYRLNEDFSVDIDDLQKKINGEQTVILLLHYFGSLQSNDVLGKTRLLADLSGSIIIEDTTHSIFTKKQTIGDYVVCSIRKWLPIAGGGVLYYNHDCLNLKRPNYSKSDDNSRIYGMILKDLFLRGVLSCNSEYRNIFMKSEEKLNRLKNAYLMSDLSGFIASCVNIDHISHQRRENYQHLKNATKMLGIKPVIDLDETFAVPLTFVIRVKNRNNLRSFLIENHIYCAIHWTFDNYKPEQRPFAIKNSNELLSLPIDHRYGTAQMQYLVDVLSRYGGELSY